MFSFGGNKTNDPKDPDWVVQVTDLIEKVVGGVRDGVVVKITTVARALVYGLLAAIVGSAAAVLFAILFVRFLDIYLDYIPGPLPENVWFAHLVAGLLFVIAGLFCRRMMKPKPDPAHAR